MLPNDVMLLLVTHTGFKMAFINVLTFLASVYVISSTYGLSGEIVSYSDPTYCAENEYFDMQLLKCISCNELKNLVPTEDSELLLIIREISSSHGGEYDVQSRLLGYTAV
jgi:hypothetical protein